MSAYLKTLGLHVYFATTKKTYFVNAKYIEANTQALDAIKQTLSKDYLSMVSHCDSAFAVWNTLISLKLQTMKYVEKKSSEDESDDACYMVQENDSLEVNSDTQLDDCATISSNDDHDSMDVDALKQTLSKKYLYIVSHCDSAFTVWNTLTSLKLQMTNHVEKEPLVMSLMKLAIWSKGLTPLR